MRRSTKNAKTKTRKKLPAPTPKPKEAKEKAEEPKSGELADPDQPLRYWGPPPALKAPERKSAYDKKFHPQDLLDQLRAGASRAEVCAAWGITYGTFNSWLETYPEMAQAIAVGQPAFDAYWRRALKDSAFGSARSVREGSLFFMLKNAAGYGDEGGSHDFADTGTNAELDFYDPSKKD